METQLNRVELKGIVGAVKCFNLPDDNKIYRISLATNYAYKAKDGSAVIETTWHEVSIPSSAIKDEAVIEKGKHLHIIGRIRNVRFTCSDGDVRQSTEILANECYPINDILEMETK